MKKLRGVAKKVKGDKKFKTLISDFLVDVAITAGMYDVRRMLSEGFRGFLARSENDLCEKFDMFVEQISNGDIKISNSQYSTTGNTRDAYLARAERIYDEIFERIILKETEKPNKKKAKKGKYELGEE